MKCEFEGQNENQKRFSYSKKHFLGVSQSDFVFRKNSYEWKHKNAMWS